MNNIEKKDLDQKIIDIVKNIINLCGTENIADTALELEEEEYGQYQEKCEELVDAIVDVVKFQEKEFNFETFYEQIPDEEFWTDIEEAVQESVDDFMKVIPYRKLPKEKRLQLLKKGFDIIYVQRENREFLAESIGDQIIADALYKILMESEYAIGVSYVSKRRFKNFVMERSGIQDEDMEYIWKIGRAHV